MVFKFKWWLYTMRAKVLLFRLDSLFSESENRPNTTFYIISHGRAFFNSGYENKKHSEQKRQQGDMGRIMRYLLDFMLAV